MKKKKNFFFFKLKKQSSISNIRQKASSMTYDSLFHPGGGTPWQALKSDRVGLEFVLYLLAQAWAMNLPELTFPHL